MAKPDKTDRLAQSVSEDLLRDLSGRPAPGRSQQLRVRGAVRTRGGPVSRPAHRPTVVLVKVPAGGQKPPYDKIRAALAKRGCREEPLDIYYLVHGKHQVALGPRELDPDEAEDKLLIDQLEPCIQLP